PYSDDNLRAALVAALAHLSSVGVTAVGDAGTGVAEDRIYREFADRGKLSTRIYGMIQGTGADFEALSARGPLIGYGSDRYYLRAVKLFADGALGSRGAALLAPYSDEHAHSGLLFMTDATMQVSVKTAIKAGYQVNVHAIGDAANHQVLDAIEAAYKEVGGRE